MRIEILVLLGLCACFTNDLSAQAQLRKLPANINHPTINVSGPFINLDGNSLIFLSDYADDDKIVMYFSTRIDGVNWKDPVMLPKTINNGLNFLKGYTLSPDGKTIYLTNSRSNGLGGFDIYKVEQRGNFWSELINVGLPLNSKGNDGSPVFSADGTAVYFMRCEKMTFDKAEGCKLMMSKKKPNGEWDEPAELPAMINTGNSQTPRIMGDGETLLFSSDKFSQGKGGMDLYMTRWNGLAWSAPVPLDFVNTSNDDQFVSATSLGRYLMKDVPGPRKSEIIEVIFPPAIKPKATMKVEGLVTPPSSFVAVFNQKDQTRIFNGKPSSSGSFIVYLNEGNKYDLSIDPEQDNYTFYSKAFDLTNDKFAQIEKISAILKPLAHGDEIELAGVSFKPNSIELTPASNQELRRVVRLIKGNPSLNFNLDITLFGYLQDSVQSDADLTEEYADTLKIPISYTITDSTSADIGKTMTRDSLVVKKMYHNDRTPHQSLEVANYLMSQGVPAKNISLSHHAIAALPENKKLIVKISVK
jgi:outer membrane protein OmpA-like peptidoglycan-associated protein